MITTFQYSIRSIILLQKGFRFRMFYSSDIIKKKICDIIHDEADNDIVFVTGVQGLGKQKLVYEIFDSEEARAFLVSDGTSITSSRYTCLQKCFIEALYRYVKQNNTTRIRDDLYEILEEYNPTTGNLVRFRDDRNFDVRIFSSLFFNMSVSELKEVYTLIASDSPLVIIANTSTMRYEDIEYLKGIHYDTSNARVTFIFLSKPERQLIELIKQLSLQKGDHVWVFPLLPDIVRPSNIDNPKSIASIKLEGFDAFSSIDFVKNLYERSNAYNELFEFTTSLVKSGFQHHHMFFLANQEMTMTDFNYVKEIATKLYGVNCEYDNMQIIQHYGKLIWIDALSYYYTIHKECETAIAETQRFYFDILLNLELAHYTRAETSSLNNLLRHAAKYHENVLATGYSFYFANFTQLIRILAERCRGKKKTLQNTIEGVILLNKLQISFSKTNLDALMLIHEKTQTCEVLDNGLQAICQFTQLHNAASLINKSAAESITSYLSVCFEAAYRWLDCTLIDGIIEACKCLSLIGRSVRITVEWFSMPEKRLLYNRFISGLEKNNIRIGDVIMPSKSIFLSYTNQDKAIVDKIDQCLQNYGYEVVRDIRNLSSWDNLDQFMRSIRKCDYVVPIVSDAYLRRENCLYEIMQLLKDEEYQKKTFPVVIEFPTGSGQSMFKPFYILSIVNHWQDEANQFEEALAKIKRENSAELDKRYRQLKQMAQNASEFLDRFFREYLSEVIIPEKTEVSKVAETINDKISSLN